MVLVAGEAEQLQLLLVQVDRSLGIHQSSNRERVRRGPDSIHRFLLAIKVGENQFE